MSNPNEDLITIKIHGSEEERQEITNRIIRFLGDLAETCFDEWKKTGWGWTLDSTRDPNFWPDPSWTHSRHERISD